MEQLLERSKLGPLFIASTSTAKNKYLVRLLDTPATLPAEARLVYLGRFQQEANQIATLQHPAILPLLDYGNYQGMPYLVSPYIPSLYSLRAHLAQHGPVATLMASRYVDQIAAALEYAHQHAILHRNLTTDGIYIETTPSNPPRLQVANFGVLHMLELSHPDGQGFRYYGSSESSAPEQLLSKPVDTYTDTYALGAVLYHLLTGQRVFTGNSYEEVVQKHLQAPVPLLSTQLRNVPPNLDSFMATAMAKEPSQRFRQPLALANAYHQIVAPQDTARPPLFVSAPDAVTPPLVTPPIIAKSNASTRRPTRSAPISRRRVLITVVVGAGAIAAVTAVGLFGSHFLSGTTSTATTTTSTPAANSNGSTATTSTQPTKSSTSSTPASGHTGTVIAKTTDIPVNGSKTFSISGQSNPGIIVHLTNNSFVAFDSTCTHAGCAVSYNSTDKLLECPCHGASFDPAKNAAVVQGPAQTPLTPIKISVNADNTITTS